MTEHEKAQAWRKRRGLTRRRLGELTGYSELSVYWFERGQAPPAKGGLPRSIDPVIWQRYRLVCAGVDAALEGREFDWS